MNPPSNPRQDEVGVVTRTFVRMAESLREVARAAEKIAAGDLRVTLQPRSEKDVLGTAFAVMAERLRHMTRELKDSVNVLASSASEILATTTQIAAGRRRRRRR